MQTAGGHRVLYDLTTRGSKATWNEVSLVSGRRRAAMMENRRTWWQQWTDINIKPLNVMRATHEPYTRTEEQVLINRRDITSARDTWDMQEFITRMYIKQLLRHPAFQLLLALLLVVNAITIALRTNSFLGQKHYELFSTIDDIVLTILICEVLLGWLNGFWIFWKDGWNILNFLIIFILLLGFFINELSSISITYTLRALRLVHVCMAVEPLARIIRVILQSVPDMANIMTLILFFMLVFSVFGVTLFGAFVPMHFQNMQVALYTLFICITQDGWVDIYRDFQMETREYAMEIGGAVYFAVFITIGAFIGINLLVVVVTTNLEQMMKAGEHGQLHQTTFREARRRRMEVTTCHWCTVRSPVWRCLASPRNHLRGATCLTSRKTPVTTFTWCSRQYRRT
ncbi:cation channel sperm-associated protein 4 isoform X2 [Panthera leo]|uniref:cation channel sperm-associated protein 4 isoform X2 n=1 Tax=Panthera leo TaxID=9689 RepID=UPI001C6985E2|nr:cation channel sperm-associated protein 4 isoform X2 [Panthera leo]